MKLKIKLLDGGVRIPQYAHADDAGLDLFSAEDGYINPGHRKVVKTGIAVQIPAGKVGFVCSRSGLAAKNGVFVLNAPGVVDSGYTGEVCVILMNDGKDLFEFHRGDRIAQLVIVDCHHAEIEEVESFDGTTERGEGGFGSTGA